MRALSGFPAVYLYTGASDMRLGVDRLSAKIKEELHRSAISGGVYVFLSRNRKKVRLFYWDRDGYAMWIKRLEVGTFRVECRDGYEEISGVDLEELLSGTDLSRLKFRKQATEKLFE